MAKRSMTDAALRWHVFPDSAALTQALVGRIVRSAQTAIVDRQVFRMVLSGGSTPRMLYATLADTDSAWAGWRLYFTDERCLPAGDPDRNDAMARSAWLDSVPIDDEHVFSIPAEFGPEQGASAYAEVLAGVGQFDVTLLGLGEDGHTASLFPGHPLGDAATASDALGVTDAPKRPPMRVSMSANRLSHSHETLVIVTGAGKRDAVRSWYRGADVPIAAVRPAAGMDIFLDAAAAAPELPATLITSGT
ncbi:MAG: 6-phosphogluconolactonase [Gammaproteobacteria bacterium]